MIDQIHEEMRYTKQWHHTVWSTTIQLLSGLALLQVILGEKYQMDIPSSLIVAIVVFILIPTLVTRNILSYNIDICGLDNLRRRWYKKKNRKKIIKEWLNKEYQIKKPNICYSGRGHQFMILTIWLLAFTTLILVLIKVVF